MTKPRIKATRVTTDRLKFTKQLAKLVKIRRISKRFTQEELAYRAGLNSAYIGHMERGIYSPTLIHHLENCKSFGYVSYTVLVRIPHIIISYSK